MMDCKAMTTPMALNMKLLSDASLEMIDATMYRQMIRSLMYLTNTRSDICFVVNTLSQFLTDPRHVHLIVANHILRYLKGTFDYGLKYKADHLIVANHILRYLKGTIDYGLKYCKDVGIQM